ncbi:MULTISPECIES: SUMF1/EgtB/PvdO family nonheme iron enzyme [unclassified Thioalkalivibrio]|uniref:SUMF1/EgtB/PvdO family nonheme iron enzyme n=1 Tax=unclassified Thioalkalivibrio TaxID=2621013 RepID=UPI000365B647|nr:MULTISPECIES: SUMF1/EgtB/PvdO family nonheme iron enzyme [unclassified Thioalkalivibrio]
MNAVHPLSHSPESDLLECLAAQHDRLNAALRATPAYEWRNQYHRDLSPIGWHYAHCHFIEAVWLHERILGEPTPTRRDWHDLYFPEQSPKWRRGGRLPPRDALLEWGLACQHHHMELLRAHPDVRRHPLLENDYLSGFLAQHHAMHLESLEQVRWFARLRRPEPPGVQTPGPAPHTSGDWIECMGGEYIVGSEAATAFDNERGRHTVCLAPHALRSQPVSNAEIAAFVEAGGYRPGPHWDAAGRAWLEHTGITAPLGWSRLPDGTRVQTLPEGTRLLDPQAPAVGLSWFEASAYARWVGARLPHEHEWEHAARAGRLRGTGAVWEWCGNDFRPYPGFRPYPYDEYSMPWFDGEHYVLRGGSAWSDPLLKRSTMRNFFTPEKRHVFAGVRLARDL